MACDQPLGLQLAEIIKREGITNRTQLAERCGKSVSTVQRNIPATLKRKGNYATGSSIRLTPREGALIEGGILGDATMIKNPRGAAFRFDNKMKDLVDWVALELDRLVARDSNQRYSQHRPVGKTWFRTATWKGDLDDLWVRWYLRGDQETSSKQIPDGFRLTPLSGLLWYLGDGSIVRKSTKERSQVIRFATNGFALAGLTDILKPQLVDILGCKGNEITIPPDRRVRGYPMSGYAISVPARYVPRWLQFIGPCPEAVPSYRYKWDYRKTVRRLWRKDELDLLGKYWGRIPHATICNGLGVTYEQARYPAQRYLGIHKAYSNSGKPLRPDPGADQRFQRDLRALKQD